MSLHDLKLQAEFPRLSRAQSRISRRALVKAGEYFALRAEFMAWQVENELLTNQGSANTLRLLAIAFRHGI